MSDRPPASHSSGLLLSPTPSPAGNATLSRVSPQYVELTPPSALVLEVTASGAFESLSWRYNGAGSAPFSLSNFNQVLSLNRTVMEHAGEYVAVLKGTALLEVVFQVHLFRELSALCTDGILFIPGFICASQQLSLSSTQMYTCLNDVDQCHYLLHTLWRDLRSASPSQLEPLGHTPNGGPVIMCSFVVEQYLSRSCFTNCTLPCMLTSLTVPLSSRCSDR